MLNKLNSKNITPNLYMRQFQPMRTYLYITFALISDQYAHVKNLLSNYYYDFLRNDFIRLQKVCIQPNPTIYTMNMIKV